MPLRKVESVGRGLANIAYVSKDSVTPSMVSVISPSGVKLSERRRIAYADPSGCLLDAITGSTIWSDPFPYITSLFPDFDSDENVDLNELIADMAMPFYYRSTRTYYGPADHAPYSEFSFSDDDDAFAPLDATKFARHPGTSDKITLIDAAGELYDGSYRILIERRDAVSIVNTGTMEYDLEHHAGNAAYRIHVFLDKMDKDLILKFPAGDVLATSEGHYVPSHIDVSHQETVEPVALYQNMNLGNVVMGDKENEPIFSSVMTDDGYRLYVPDRAKIDKRHFDFFFWRIVGEFQRTTDISAIIDDTIPVGVIGSSNTNLDNFLDGDGIYNFKFKCTNPGRAASAPRWNVDASQAAACDLAIVAGRYVDWGSIGTRVLQASRQGTTVWFNLGGATGSYVGSFIDAHSMGPSFMPPFALGAATTFSNLTVKDGNDHVTKLVTGFDLTAAGEDLRVARDGGGFRAQEIYACRYVIADGTTKSWTFSDAGDLHGVWRVAEYNRNRIIATPAITHSNHDTSTWTIEVATPPTAGNVVCVYFTIDPTSDSVIMTADNKVVGWNPRNNVWVTTLGLDSMTTVECKRFTSNMIAASSRGVESKKDATSLTKYTITSPWKLSWAAGVTKTGEPILEQDELDRYHFFVDVDETSGMRMIPKRIVSMATAETLIRKSANGGRILPTDKITYKLELCGYDGQTIQFNPSIKGNERPIVWTNRVSEKSVIPSGYRITEFEDEDNQNSPLIPLNSLSGQARVSLVVEDDDPVDAPIGFTVSAILDIVVSSTKDVVIKAGDPYVKRVTTQSDIDWFLKKNSNPYSLGNLTHWATIDAVKWYPFEGHSFLVDQGHTGDSVRYVQGLMNAIHRHGGDAGNGDKNPYLPLAVDGVFGGKMDSAVRWYQDHWDIKLDGDVDAGTLGHMMRNANRVGVTWTEFKESFDKYGRVENLIDGDLSTMHGRRTWINTRTGQVDDAVIVFLNSPLKIKNLSLVPYLETTKSSPSGAKYLHVTRYGGTINGSKRWSFHNEKHPLQLKNDVRYDFPINNVMMDTLYVNLFQDQAVHPDKPMKMWGMRSVEWLAEVPSTTITRTVTSYTYDETMFTFSTGSSTTIVYNPIPAELRKFFVGYDKTNDQIATEILAGIPSSIRSTFNVVVTVQGDGTIEVIITKVNPSFVEEDIFGTPWDFTIDQGDEIEVAPADLVYWPDLTVSGLLSDDNWDGEFKISITSGDVSVTPVFYDMVTKETFDTIDYNELMSRGIDRVRPAVLSHTVDWSDRTPSTPTRFPKRYAMKPFCVVTRSVDGTLPVLGIDGNDARDSWGVKVKVGAITRKVTVPESSGILAGKEATCLYSVSGRAYSTTYGVPYVFMNELASSVDVDTVQLSMSPVLPDSVSLSANGDTLEIIDVDSATGLVRFRSQNGVDYLDGVDATYVARQEWISYKGDENDLLDLCPASGHWCTIDGDDYETKSLAGKTIYIYLLPTSVTIDGSTTVASRTIFHSLIDPSSNPFAITIAKIVVSTSSRTGDIQIIDVRRGGGGLADETVNDARKITEEVDGFYDIGFTDGDAYMIGGTVVMRLPAAWRDTWNDQGVDFDAMVEEFCRRWIPPGKTHVIEWVEVVPTASA